MSDSGAPGFKPKRVAETVLSGLVLAVLAGAWREGCAVHDEQLQMKIQRANEESEIKDLNGRVFDCETRLRDVDKRVTKVENRF